MHFQHKECPIIYFKRPSTFTKEASLLLSLSLICWKHQKEPPWHYQFCIDTISEQMLLVWINQNHRNKQHNPREQYLPQLRTSTSFTFWIVCFNTIKEALMLSTLSLSIQQYYCKNHNIYLTFSMDISYHRTYIFVLGGIHLQLIRSIVQ